MVVENAAPATVDTTTRDDALRRALVAVHLLLGVDDGAFVSLLDPDDGARAAVAGCDGDGTFRCSGGDDRVMLVADHPVRPPGDRWSDGDLCDATGDRRDPRARAPDPDRRGEGGSPCHRPPRGRSWTASTTWRPGPSRLHGDASGVRARCRIEDADVAVPWWGPAVDAAVDPWSDTLLVGGVEVGEPVRLGRRADAHDMFLRRWSPPWPGVFHDVDDEAPRRGDGRRRPRPRRDARARSLPVLPSRRDQAASRRTEVAVALLVRRARARGRDQGTSSSATTASASKWPAWLRRRPARDGVRVEDYGIAASTSPTSCSTATTLVLVDAVPMDEPAGTVVVMEPIRRHPLTEDSAAPCSRRSMDPVVVLDLLAGLGGTLGPGAGGRLCAGVARRGDRPVGAGRGRSRPPTTPSRTCSRPVRRSAHGCKGDLPMIRSCSCCRRSRRSPAW